MRRGYWRADYHKDGRGTKLVTDYSWKMHAAYSPHPVEVWYK
jgi:hypothetical protein